MTPEELTASLDDDLRAAGVDIPKPEDTTDPDPVAEYRTQIESLKAELDGLKGYVQGRERIVHPEPEPNRSQPQNNQNQFQPRKMTTEQYVKIANEDPTRATLEAINASLGLPEGSNPFQFLQPIAQRLQAHEDALKQTQESMVQDRIWREAEAFKTSHPDYQVNQANFDILEQYRTEYNLPPTAAAWDLAYTKAIANGDITVAKGKGQTEPEVNEPQVTRAAARVPSVRRSSTSVDGGGDWDSIQSKLDQMSTEDAKRYISKLTGSAF